jgi:hypothetical protein
MACVPPYAVGRMPDRASDLRRKSPLRNPINTVAGLLLARRLLTNPEALTLLPARSAPQERHHHLGRRGI